MAYFKPPNYVWTQLLFKLITIPFLLLLLALVVAQVALVHREFSGPEPVDFYDSGEMFQ